MQGGPGVQAGGIAVQPGVPIQGEPRQAGQGAEGGNGPGQLVLVETEVGQAGRQGGGNLAAQLVGVEIEMSQAGEGAEVGNGPAQLVGVEIE